MHILKTSLIFIFISLCFPGISKGMVVTFAGDYSETGNTVATLSRINSLSPDFHIALGDLSYSAVADREPEWCNLVKANVSAPFLLVPGNHESNGKNGRIEEFAKCLPYTYSSPMRGVYPEQYYFDAPGPKPLARFIMISPDLKFADGRRPGYRMNSPESNWVESVIRDAKRSNIPWIIVGMHKVCITTEGKGCEVGLDIIDTLISEGVDIVFAGHVHAYERTHQLSCMTKDIYEPNCVANNTGNFTKGSGTVFTTVGTGGVKIRRLNATDEEAPYFARALGLAEGEHYGPVVLNINENQITEQFIDSYTGEILDQFSISR